MQFDLVGIGECMVEFRSATGCAESDDFRVAWGGDVINTLTHASRLGLRTAFQTRVGNDAFGRRLRDDWRREGLDLSRSPIVPGENGLYFITNDENGERSFSYRRSGSAASKLAPEDLDAKWILGARHLLLSGITQAISDSASRLVSRAAEVAGRRGIYDPNYRPALWDERGGTAAARDAFHEIAPRAGWLVPSYPADAVLVQAEGAEEALDRFAAACDGPVAMKMGADGVLLRWERTTKHVRAAPVGAVLDTTGAGDAWNAGFIYGLCHGEGPESAAERANKVAAGVLAFPGAIPPSVQTV